MKIKLFEQYLNILNIESFLIFLLKTINDIKINFSVDFDIENIHIYGSVIKKNLDLDDNFDLKYSKDIDIFLEISNFKSYKKKFCKNILEFKELLHDNASDLLVYNGKFIDINVQDYSIEYEGSDFEPNKKIF
jgi:hypothetical protein